MKILHVQKVAGIAGSERHLLELLPALSSRGLEVSMCVLGTGGSRSFVEALRDNGVDVGVLPAGPVVNPPLVGKITRMIGKCKADLIHTHLIHADVHGQIAARLARVPAVSTVHSTNPFYRRQPYLFAARFAGHLASRNIVISRHVDRFVEKLGLARPGTVRVVHYGIDVPEMHMIEVSRSRARYDLKASDVAVGVASRLFPHKGHNFLFEAFKKAHEEVAHLCLLVAGEGPLRRHLESEARTSLPGASVRFLGYVDDIHSFLNACDVVVFPSLPGYGEGFGLAALEAMAAGRPVVATAIDSLPELVVDGETGFLVTPGDVQGLADILVKLARDDGVRTRLGFRARERAQTVFPLEAMVERTLNVYREVT